MIMTKQSKKVDSLNADDDRLHFSLRKDGQIDVKYPKGDEPGHSPVAPHDAVGLEFLAKLRDCEVVYDTPQAAILEAEENDPETAEVREEIAVVAQVMGEGGDDDIL